jgi:hypothetical protein
MSFRAARFEDPQDRLAVKRIDLVEGYIQSEIYLVIKLGIGWRAKEYDLIFSAIPSGVLRNLHAQVPGDHEAGIWPQQHGADGSKRAAFAGVTQGVQCEQEIVPSLVWLEPTQQRANLHRDLLGVRFNTLFKTFGGVREEKALATRIDATGSGSDNRDRLVQSVAKALCDARSEFTNSGSHEADEYDLVQFVARVLRIRFHGNLVAIVFNEFPDFPFEVRQLFASPGNLAERVVKCLGHDGDSSNWTPLLGWANEHLRAAARKSQEFEHPARQWRRHVF